MGGDQWGGESTAWQAPIPSHVEEKTSTRSASEGEVPEDEPPSQVESSQDQPPLEPDEGAAPEVVIIDGDEDTSEETQGSSTPRSGRVQGWKQCLGDQSPCPLPSRNQMKEEVEEGTPQREAALPKGVKKEDLLPKRSEVYTLDHSWVQQVWGSLLRLETGATPSEEDINTSELFVLRSAVGTT